MPPAGSSASLFSLVAFERGVFYFETDSPRLTSCTVTRSLPEIDRLCIFKRSCVAVMVDAVGLGADQSRCSKSKKYRLLRSTPLPPTLPTMPLSSIHLKTLKQSSHMVVCRSFIVVLLTLAPRCTWCPAGGATADSLQPTRFVWDTCGRIRALFWKPPQEMIKLRRRDNKQHI